MQYAFLGGSADNITKYKLPNGEFAHNMIQQQAGIINSMAINDDGVVASGADNGSLWCGARNRRLLLLPCERSVAARRPRPPAFLLLLCAHRVTVHRALCSALRQNVASALHVGAVHAMLAHSVGIQGWFCLRCINSRQSRALRLRW